MSLPSRLLLLLLVQFPAPGWTSPSCYPPSVIQVSLGNCTVVVQGRTDVHSWGFKVGVDGADDLCVVPSTVLASTFLTTEDVCADDELTDAHNLTMTPEQCRSRRGGFISRAQPLPAASTDGLDEANRNWKALGNNITAAAQVTLKLFNAAVPMVVGLISGGQHSTASHLGLSLGSVFLQALKDKGLIAARSFGIDAGSQSTESPRRGSLILGGYDRASFTSSYYREYPVSKEKVGKRYCPLQVLVHEITLTGSSMGTATSEPEPVISTVVKRPSNTRFCIEPYDNLFRLPSVDVVQGWFKNVTPRSNGTVNASEYSTNLINLEPGLVYPSRAGSFNGNMRITIEGDMVVDIPLHELWRPLRGLDPTGQAAQDDRYNELQIFGVDPAADAPVLGKAFLSQVYLFVDYEAQPPVFRLVPQTQEATPGGAVSSASCSGGLSATDKGLIAVGSVLGALVVGLAAYALLVVVSRACARRPPPRRNPPAGDESNPGPIR